MERYNGTIQVGEERNWFDHKYVTIITPLKCSDSIEKDINRLGIDPYTHPTLLGGFRVWKDICVNTKTINFINTMRDLAGTNGKVKAVKPNAMRRAWEIRREAAAKFGCKVSEISMSDSLKLAWKEIKNNAAKIAA